MKKILKIAQLELSTLFYSPIAWVLLVIFVFQSGLTFVETLAVYQKGVFLGRVDYQNFTRMIFANEGSGLFQGVKASLFLYIPLLTMGLISKELSSGSIKLLLSSPVRNREIVLGKFLSMMVYGLILMATLLIFVIIGAFAIPSFDLSNALAGMLGLYLLLCAYAAIGLFISSLSSYQVIVAIGTLVMLAFLNYVGQVGQRIDFVRDLTYFLSIAGRIDYFIYGMISSKDIFYFLIVISLFLGITIIRLQSGRESRPFYVTAGRYLVLFMITLGLGYLSSRPGAIFYFDATATQTLTLTKNSQAVLKKITKPVKITTYVNLLNTYASYYGMPENVNIDKSRFEQYTRFLPDLQMDYVYYWDRSPDKVFYKRNPGLNDEQLARKVAASDDLDLEMFAPPSVMRRQISLEDENYNFVRQIEYEGKKTFLRIYNDNERHPSEQEITAAFAKLITKIPVVAFLQGRGERGIDSRRDEGFELITKTKGFRYSLINQGYEVTPVRPGEKIPSNVALLVIADPLEAYDPNALEEIINYIKTGGCLIILTEHSRSALTKPILDELGVQLSKTPILEPSADFASELIFASLSPAAAGLDTVLKPMIGNERKKISMPDVSSLSFDSKSGFCSKPFLFNRLGLCLGLALERNIANKMQRVIVLPDADFISNVEVGRFNTGNFELYPALFKWVSKSQFPVNVSRPVPPDSQLKVSRDQILVWRRTLLFGVPALILVAGAFLLIRRKRR